MRSSFRDLSILILTTIRTSLTIADFFEESFKDIKWQAQETVWSCVSGSLGVLAGALVALLMKPHTKQEVAQLVEEKNKILFKILSCSFPQLIFIKD